MKLPLLAGCAVACLLLAGCNGLAAVAGSPGQADAKATLQQLGEHIDKCERDYQGSLGVGASFNFKIHCEASDVTPAPADPAATSQ